MFKLRHLAVPHVSRQHAEQTSLRSLIPNNFPGPNNTEQKGQLPSKPLEIAARPKNHLDFLIFSRGSHGVHLKEPSPQDFGASGVRMI